MKIYLESLGCDKNLVDSEIMMGLMDRNGYELTNDVDEADVAVVNTCCFIGDAKEESIGRIIAMGEKKKEGIPTEALRLLKLLNSHLPLKTSASVCSEFFNLSKNELYRAGLEHPEN